MDQAVSSQHPSFNAWENTKPSNDREVYDHGAADIKPEEGRLSKKSTRWLNLRPCLKKKTNLKSIGVLVYLDLQGV